MKLKSPLIDVDDKCNEIFLSYSFFNDEFISGKHLVNTFSDHFSFHPHTLNIQKHIENLEEIAIRASSDLFLSICYDLKSLELDNRTTLILSNTRELNRDPFTK